MKNNFNIDDKLIKISRAIEDSLEEIFKQLENIQEYNNHKILKSFIKNKVCQEDLYSSTGYGYEDRGREKLDDVFSNIMCCEDSLVRSGFASGTHAISVALFGVLRPNDVLISVTGKPYDTLDTILGLNDKKNTGSLKEFGIIYKNINLLEDGTPDYEKIKLMASKAKVIYIQRSCGYSLRPSININIIKKICKISKQNNPKIIIIVDNCYGEFVETMEPTNVGADLIIGSLIKNPGGCIAKCGGYISGKKNLLDLVEQRFICPGIYGSIGATLNTTRDTLMGLYFAPMVTCNALKTAIFTAKLFEYLGYDTHPKYNQKRTDIIQGIILNNKEALINFCKFIQSASPIDSFVTPIPGSVAGYSTDIIMASGSFTSGSTIELSVDAPLIHPYIAWMQGGPIYQNAKIAILHAANELIKQNQL